MSSIDRQILTFFLPHFFKIIKVKTKYVVFIILFFSKAVFSHTLVHPVVVDMYQHPEDIKGAMNVFSWGFDQAGDESPVFKVSINRWYADTLFLRDPLLIKEVLTNHGESLIRGCSWDSLRELLGKRSIVCTAGDEQHQQDKKRIGRYVYTSSISKDHSKYWDYLNKRINHQVDTWRENGETGDLFFDVRAMIMKFFIDMFYGCPQTTDLITAGELDDMCRKVSSAFKDAFEPMFKPSKLYGFLGNIPLWGLNEYWHSCVIWKYYPKIQDTRDVMTAFVRQRATSIQVESGPEFSCYAADIKAQEYSQEEHLTHLRTIILAGLDTTAPTVTFGLEELMFEPDLQGEIYSEVCKHLSEQNAWPAKFASSGTTCSYMPVLEKMVEAFVRENPAIGITFRDVQTGFCATVPEKNGVAEYSVQFNKGDRVVLLLTKMTSDNIFNQRRYGSDAAENMPVLSFFAGAHKCPGNGLARVIFKVMVAKCIYALHLMKVSDSQVSVARCLQISTVPHKSILVKFDPRDH
ncbi:cytochrome P450 [Endozoicomonadaceae bacterium StTr2]